MCVQAWGVMEAGAGHITAARECFSRGVAANERNVPLLTAWARLEVGGYTCLPLGIPSYNVLIPRANLFRA